MLIKHELFAFTDIPALWESTVGLERETMRVKEDGSISPLPHSSEWGQRDEQPYIQTDFAESQLEFITPPESEPQKLLAWLAAEHQIASQTNVKNNEYLWPYSVPAYVPDNRDEVKTAQLSDKKEKAYREYLADYYGKDVQLISGIHYNIQITPALVRERSIDLLLSQQEDITEDKIRDIDIQLYEHLARNYLRYRWLLTYLLGASPYIASNYETNLYGKPHKNVMRSFRQSRYGYHNHPKLKVSYTSLERLIHDVEEAVQKGKLSVEKELYTDIRFRHGNPLRTMLEDGIDYIELRNFDLNPYAPYGITLDDIKFVKLFVLTLLFMKDVKTQDAVDLGNMMNREIAEDDPLAHVPYPNEANLLFELLKEVATHLVDIDPSLIEIIKEKEEMLALPELTLAGRLVTQCPNHACYLKCGMKLAKQHQKLFLEKPYTLHGFESFELSTQDVIKEAIKRGINVRILDETDNLIQLTYRGHSEIIRNGNMTAKDTLIAFFLLDNKLTTKTLLTEAGIKTPAGHAYNKIEKARLAYPYYSQKPLVIKPKNTNYGLGITIFSDGNYTRDEYDKALEIAFAEDDTVLLEDFVAGTEVRFYVQGDDVLAVVERQPAQIKGDGLHTISQLIALENENPLRGPAHFAPLTLLEEGDAEVRNLQHAGWTMDSIPPKDEVIFLRNNSNISTGGLSIDRTDEVHPAYKEIAIRASQALKAYISGIDMLITDWTLPPQDGGQYAIIEGNYNPMMTLHRYPGIGKERYVGAALLDDLFPESSLP